MFAAVKTPNTGDLDLAKAGVEVNNKGTIKVSNQLQTSASHIFAAGDVIDKPLRLETTAGKEGKIAAENALENKNKETDEQVIQSGIKCACNTLSFEMVPKAAIINETRGLIKIVADNKTHQVHGIHILGPEAADLIHEATMIVRNKMTLEEIIDTVHVFPTLSEVIKLAAQSFFKDIAKLSCCIE